MKVRDLFSLAAATGLAIPALAVAQQPAPLPISASAANPNQQLADSVASRLRGNEAVTGSNITRRKSGSSANCRSLWRPPRTTFR